MPSTLRPTASDDSGRSRLVTNTGAAVILLGFIGYVTGVLLGWVELQVVAAGCLIALAIAVPFVLGRPRLAIERLIADDRISVGETIKVELVVTNNGRAPTRRSDIDEIIGGSTLSLSVAGLAAGASEHLPYELTPPRRTRLTVGPTVIARSDPLGLLRRSVGQCKPTTCWVYPATRLLAPLPLGFAKDLEGPTSDASPVGDVAFHAVRPYTTGDDRRHIHWLSTAKTGQLMVRHYVDNRRPHLAVLLDTNADFYDEESFEVAVSIASSMSASMIDQQLPVSARIGHRTVIGQNHAGGRNSVLEAMTECELDRPKVDGFVASVAQYIRAERSASALAIVTGTRTAADLLPAVVDARRHARVIVIPVAQPDDGVDALPDARVLRAASLSSFAARWAAMVR